MKLCVVDAASGTYLLSQRPYQQFITETLKCAVAEGYRELHIQVHQKKEVKLLSAIMKANTGLKIFVQTKLEGMLNPNIEKEYMNNLRNVIVFPSAEDELPTAYDGALILRHSTVALERAMPDENVETDTPKSKIIYKRIMIVSLSERNGWENLAEFIPYDAKGVMISCKPAFAKWIKGLCEDKLKMKAEILSEDISTGDGLVDVIGHLPTTDLLICLVDNKLTKALKYLTNIAGNNQHAIIMRKEK